MTIMISLQTMGIENTVTDEAIGTNQGKLLWGIDKNTIFIRKQNGPKLQPFLYIIFSKKKFEWQKLFVIFFFKLK